MIFWVIIIWAKATFFFEQLFRSWPEHGELQEVGFFFGPKISVFVQKSDFCHTTPILVNDPFLALVMTVNFRPWERLFDFPFPELQQFP